MYFIGIIFVFLIKYDVCIPLVGSEIKPYNKIKIFLGKTIKGVILRLSKYSGNGLYAYASTSSA